MAISDKESIVNRIVNRVSEAHHTISSVLCYDDDNLTVEDVKSLVVAELELNRVIIALVRKSRHIAKSEAERPLPVFPVPLERSEEESVSVPTVTGQPDEGVFGDTTDKHPVREIYVKGSNLFFGPDGAARRVS